MKRSFKFVNRDLISNVIIIRSLGSPDLMKARRWISRLLRRALLCGRIIDIISLNSAVRSVLISGIDLSRRVVHNAGIGMQQAGISVS